MKYCLIYEWVIYQKNEVKSTDSLLRVYMSITDILKNNEDKLFLSASDKRDVFDEELRTRFLSKLKSFDFDIDRYKKESIRSKYELIVLLDQFSRHVFRNCENSVDEFWEAAYILAEDMCDKDEDLELPFCERLYVLLAIRHKNTYEDLLQYVANYYHCSFGEAEEYIDIIREAGVRGILWEMGVNEKETDKLIKKAKL